MGSCCRIWNSPFFMTTRRFFRSRRSFELANGFPATSSRSARKPGRICPKSLGSPIAAPPCLVIVRNASIGAGTPPPNNFAGNEESAGVSEIFPVRNTIAPPPRKMCAAVPRSCKRTPHCLGSLTPSVDTATPINKIEVCRTTAVSRSLRWSV